jgi:DNA-binding NarL/FixJ family response regulator
MIRLMIADDHALVREGLKQIMALQDDIVVTAEAANGIQTLELLQQNGFDMILLDMSMPGVSGINLITRIRAQRPTLPILILSMHNEPQFAQRALNAGANGYATKGGDLHALLAGIRKVATGGCFVEPALARVMSPAGSGIKGAATLQIA